VLAMTRELAVIHARQHIRVNALSPGPPKTELLMSFLNTEAKKQRRLVHVPMGRFGEAAEIARAALFLASDESSYVTGTEFLVERQLASERDIDTALATAVAAEHNWKQVPVTERVALVRRMVEWCIARADVLGREITQQMGRPIAYTPNEIRRGFQERALYMCSIADGALAEARVEPKDGFERFIRREPLGVMLVVAPWNYPWLTSVNAVVPALLAGNAVVLKMAQQTPLVAERYAEALAAVGLPPGVFQYLHMDHAQTARVIGDARISFVAFTGSVPGGHAVQRAAAERFIATGLELGGNDPAYVRPDAPLRATIENLVDGAYFNSGQSCCGIQRIYVHRSLYQPFVDGFVDLTRKYRLGNPLEPATTLGPMVRADAAASVRAQIQGAVSQGAKPLI